MAYSRQGASDPINYEFTIDEMVIAIGQDIAGVVKRHPGDLFSFEYRPDYHGTPLSYCIDHRSASTHLTNTVTPWLEGLLPDNKAVRSSMGKPYGISGEDTFGLLAQYGKDCPGAVKLCHEPEIDSVLSEQGGYELITDTEISERLKDAADSMSPDWHGEQEHWSLGGAQGKFALARINDNWYRCTGASASTHIFKPGVTAMTDQALVEYTTMQLAELSHLQVAKTRYEIFDGTPAIVVQRYDRIVDNGTVLRLHQEDLCQALSYMPIYKYLVTPAEIISVLSHDNRYDSTSKFVDAVFFNYLAGGTDAHAKNFSILHSAGSIALAPLYDMASILPYQKQRESPRRVAIPIGGEKRIGQLRESHIDKFARNNGLNAHATKNRAIDMARGVLDALEKLPERCAGIPGSNRVVEPLMRAVRANCEALLANIGSGGRYIAPNWKELDCGTLPWRSEDKTPAMPNEESVRQADQAIQSAFDAMIGSNSKDEEPIGLYQHDIASKAPIEDGRNDIRFDDDFSY